MSKALYIFYVLVLTIIFFILNNNLDKKTYYTVNQRNTQIHFFYFIS